MKNGICDTCGRKKNCNTFDRSRGMACKDFTLQDPHNKEQEKQEDKK